MPDGSVVVVAMLGKRLTRVQPDGSKETIAEIAGGPNGAAIGPDGALYLCNNGGCFMPLEFGDMLFPGSFDPGQYIGGRIQRVDLSSGDVTDLYYAKADGSHISEQVHPVEAPNGIGLSPDGSKLYWAETHNGRVFQR